MLGDLAFVVDDGFLILGAGRFAFLQSLICVRGTFDIEMLLMELLWKLG